MHQYSGSAVTVMQKGSLQIKDSAFGKSDNGADALYVCVNPSKLGFVTIEGGAFDNVIYLENVQGVECM